MDHKTLGAYDGAAAAFAKEWHEQPPPTDLQSAVLQYFKPGRTADIGCGSGRDAAWLDDHGFPAVGFDVSAGLLTEARRRYPQIRLRAEFIAGTRGDRGRQLRQRPVRNCDHASATRRDRALSAKTDGSTRARRDALPYLARDRRVGPARRSRPPV